MRSEMYEHDGPNEIDAHELIIQECFPDTEITFDYEHGQVTIKNKEAFVVNGITYPPHWNNIIIAPAHEDLYTIVEEDPTQLIYAINGKIIEMHMYN